LVVEDDQSFAKVLFNFAHAHEFKCLVAPTGEEGLELATSYKPAAIILDINLPNMNGWEILRLLKQNPDTRHIPVHIMSVYDTADLDAFKRGAMGYLTKPVSPEELENSFEQIEKFITRKVNQVLLVEDDPQLSYSVKRLLEGNDVSITECSTGRGALDLLHQEHFDCMILDLTLPDMTGFEVLNQLHEQSGHTYCPVIVYTGRELSREETTQLMKYADSVIVKGVKSPERLLDETALFLHRVVADMPAEKQQTIREMYNKESHLQGKKILVVDDDMRNSFALSKLLTDKGLNVEIAGDGQKALTMLDNIPDIDLVLMDVMMPVMDGLETMRRIRQNPQLSQLPIIALTAKAMQGDRENCISAGANDYLSKPIDIDRLLSLLRVWLYK
jgi:CheY-like chemotaxis protein